MKPIYEFFVSSKYQKAKDSIFHAFLVVLAVTGLLFVFTGINLPCIIFAIIFVAYEIPNTILNSVDTYLSAKKKR